MLMRGAVGVRWVGRSGQVKGRGGFSGRVNVFQSGLRAFVGFFVVVFLLHLL